MKKITISMIVLMFILIFTIVTMQTYNIKQSIEKNANEQNARSITYKYYGSRDGKGEALITFVDNESGISRIELPDGRTIYPNQKKKVAIDYLIEVNNENTFKMYNEQGEECKKTIILGDKGIVQQLAPITDSGSYKVELIATDEILTYTVNYIAYDGNLVLDGVTNIDGATLENNVYEFGDKTVDVANQSEYAKNMVVLRVNGNLTINEGVTLTACKSDDGYGGPKGMLIYCTGTITNQGTISMTARGAMAEGENVYLWKNSDDTYEYVPKVGGTGGASKEIVYKIGNFYGNNGNNGQGRQTGGRWFRSSLYYRSRLANRLFRSWNCRDIIFWRNSEEEHVVQIYILVVYMQMLEELMVVQEVQEEAGILAVLPEMPVEVREILEEKQV